MSFENMEELTTPMVEILHSDKLSPSGLDPLRDHWTYCGLDSCLTVEIFEHLLPMLDNQTGVIYDFVKSLQKPALAMMTHGVAVDLAEKAGAEADLGDELVRLRSYLDRIAEAVWEKPLNAQSSLQLREFFYGVMKIPEITFRGKVTVGKAALEKLDQYFWASFFTRTIVAIRDKAKLLSALRSGVDADGRMRTSYLICGTTTGRWASRENVFGRGTNMQNLTERLRRIFVADPGKKFAYVDLQQAEARAVAYLAGDDELIKACNSSDLHTAIARLCFPTLPWVADPVVNRKIAERPYFAQFSYRDMAKRAAHGTNYGARDFTIARHLKISLEIAQQFQRAYFRAFPKVREWQLKTAATLQTTGTLTTPFGRRRVFFSRLDDDSTVREAIAFVPQSLVAELLNAGMLRVFETKAI